jgi:gamma-glutamyl hydrolase
MNNNRPVIGILAQPVSDEEKNDDRHSYIAASYIKYIEGAGARVVPIPYDLPQEQLFSLFTQLNGLLFPGGGTDLNGTEYFHVQEYLLTLALKSGKYFPVWGTCLGMQAISMIVAQDLSVLTHGWDSWNISMPLDFYPNAQQVRSYSRLFGRQNMPSDEMFWSFQDEALTLNNHHDGVTTDNWFNNKNLATSFRVLSTNKDRKGSRFISTAEMINYPVYIVQWHPEKPVYEWREDEDINHSYASVLANQHMANFFVNECRNNTNTFKSNSDLLNKWLIYNYEPVYSYSYEPDFVQMYYFPKSSSQ